MPGTAEVRRVCDPRADGGGEASVAASTTWAGGGIDTPSGAPPGRGCGTRSASTGSSPGRDREAVGAAEDRAGGGDRRAISAWPMATGSAAAGTRTSAWMPAGDRACAHPAQRAQPGDLEGTARARLDDEVIGCRAIERLPRRHRRPSTPGPTGTDGPLTLPGARHCAAKWSPAGAAAPGPSRRMAYGGMRMPPAEDPPARSRSRRTRRPRMPRTWGQAGRGRAIRPCARNTPKATCVADAIGDVNQRRGRRSSDLPRHRRRGVERPRSCTRRARRDRRPQQHLRT